jgi:predicted transcriptional regulator
VSKIDLVLEILEDGRWHEVKELKQSLNLNDDELQEIIGFLSNYELAEFDGMKEMVRINRDFQKLRDLNAA